MTVTLPIGAPRLRRLPISLADALIVHEPACPACGGEWIHHLTFAHTSECRLRPALDSTAAADAGKLRPGATLTRRATAAETDLAYAIGVPERAAEYVPAGQPTPAAEPLIVEVAALTSSVHVVSQFDGISLDALCTPAEYEAASDAND